MTASARGPLPSRADAKVPDTPGKTVLLRLLGTEKLGTEKLGTEK
jgi:hypothetical protein